METQELHVDAAGLKGMSPVPDKANALSLYPWVAGLDARNEGNVLAMEIGACLADGERMGDIARRLMGEAKPGRLLMWLRADVERYSAYCAGLEARADEVVMEGLEIVDGALDKDEVPSAKLRSDYRRWLAGKWDKGRFGDAGGSVQVGVGVKIILSTGESNGL